MDEDALDPKGGCSSRSSTLYERKFRLKWLGDPRFSSWLTRSPSNPNKAYCKVCERELAGSVTFLERHKSTNKHAHLLLNRTQLSKSKNSISSFQSEKIAEWKVAGYVLRENLAFSQVESLSSLIKSLNPSQSHTMTHTRALTLLQNMGQYHRNHFFESTLKKTSFSLIFINDTAMVRFVDPVHHRIKTSHFPWRDEKVMDLTPWPNLVATVNAPPHLTNEIIQKRSDHTFLRLESMERHIEDITVFALQALPSECLNGAWEIAKFISIKKTDHFQEFRDLVIQKGIVSDKNVLKGGGNSLSLEEIVEFITSNWSSVMFWLASLELIEESSSFLQRFYDNTSMELYFAFLNYILPCLSKMKSEFQCEEFRLHRLKSSLQNSIRSILQNFIDPNLISLDRVSSGIPSDTYLNLNDVYRGTMTHEILKKRDLIQVDLDDFYFKTFNFYIHLEKGLLEHFSSNSSWWRSLDYFEALDPYNALRRKPSSIIPLANRFPNLVSHAYYEKLNQEWRELSVYKDNDRLEDYDPESFWKKVAHEKIGSSRRFPHLSDLAMSLITVAHSSSSGIFFEKELNEIKAKENLQDSSSLHLLLFAKDFLRETDSSWEPPRALMNSELSKVTKS